MLRKGDELMSKIRTILALCLCIFIAVLSIGYITIGMHDKEEETTPSATDSSADSTTAPVTVETPSETVSESNTAETIAQESTTQQQTTTEAQTMGNEYEFAYAGFNPAVATVDGEKWNLLLVNQSYILPDGYSVQTAEVTGSSQKLDYRVVPYYNDMIKAAKADGIDLIPVSGYRTIERQRNNFNRKINYYSSLGYSKAEATRLAAKIVLMPGTSEHNAGLAMDFGTNGNTTLDENFANTKAFKWLSENAADYGFILRYEKDTTNITKVTYEPWHWRYVGVEAAKEIKARGVTLEEYLGMA